MRKIRPSSYTVIVPMHKGYCILLHGYSGAIDVVTEDIAFLLECNDSYIGESMDVDTINMLLKRGYLTTRTIEEEQSYVGRLAQALHRKDKLLTASFTALVTYDCNFRCPYCFEKNSNIRKLQGHVMSKEMADNMFRCIENILSTKQYKTTNILLYGGEPLLAENKSIIEHIVNEGKKRSYTFKAITNGYDLDSFLDLLSPSQIGDIQVTIDGMEVMHNSKRVHKDGAPTFSRIVSNIGMALAHNVQVTVRYNTDKSNVVELVQLRDYFRTLGYTESPNFRMDSARLKANGDNIDKDLLFSQKEFIAEHERLNLDDTCHDYNMRSKILSAIRNRKPLPYSSTFCGSQSSSYVFDPYGKIYPCLEVVGTPMHQIGCYNKGILEQYNDNKTNWRATNVMSFSPCRKCKYALLCGGGCYAQNIKSHRCINMEDTIRLAVRQAYATVN